MGHLLLIKIFKIQCQSPHTISSQVNLEHIWFHRKIEYTIDNIIRLIPGSQAPVKRERKVLTPRPTDYFSKSMLITGSGLRPLTLTVGKCVQLIKTLQKWAPLTDIQRVELEIFTRHSSSDDLISSPWRGHQLLYSNWLGRCVSTAAFRQWLFICFN